MKNLKAFSLAAVMALMALAGAGSASAAEVYSTGVTQPAGTTIAGSLTPGTTWKETSTDTKTTLTTCTGYSYHGTIAPYTGGSVKIDVSSWSLINCSATTDTLSNGSFFVSSTGTVSGEGTVFTVNFGGVSCRYGTGGGTHLGTVSTGALAINAVINEQEPKAFLCPDSTEWTGTTRITVPHDVTVS